uniref:Uncharacterized protein n=1 Tax=Kalanchoe fedtschenkoi TaxID=63787 RepID=A0A7N0RGZ5_KALFE
MLKWVMSDGNAGMRSKSCVTRMIYTIRIRRRSLLSYENHNGPRMQLRTRCCYPVLSCSTWLAYYSLMR